MYTTHPYFVRGTAFHLATFSDSVTGADGAACLWVGEDKVA